MGGSESDKDLGSTKRDPSTGARISDSTKKRKPQSGGADGGGGAGGGVPVRRKKTMFRDIAGF